jgi:arylsulfatase A-like enzyme
VDVSGVRYDEVAPAGDAVPAKSLMPGFRALDEGGAFFTQAAASAGWDAPSLAGLFSGLSPDQCTVQGRPADGQRTMIPAIETLAEMLADGGYATAAFTAGGHVARHSGLQQGFATWDEEPDDAKRLQKASSWLSALQKGTPYFLFFHASTADADGKADPAGRGPRLARLDELVGTLRSLTTVPTVPRDDGWFVVLSDHGDVLSPREGGLDPGDTGTLDAQIRVPLAIAGPGFPKGSFDASVSLLDVLPTIRDLLGLERKALVEGRSWKPILGSPGARGRPALSQGWRRARLDSNPTKQRLVSVRAREAKFTAEFDLGTGNWTEAIFDLLADPTEAKPLPVGDVARHGDDFARSVALVREALKGRKAIYDDALTGPYVLGGGGAFAPKAAGGDGEKKPR